MIAIDRTSIGICTPDGTADAYLARPDGGNRHPAVLVYMDAFGLRPDLEKTADRLAEAGYTVLVPNLFYRYGRAPVVDLPDFIDRVSGLEIFEHVLPIMKSLTPRLAMRDADVYLRWLADSPLTTDGPVAITGYCMGAGLALRTAGTYPGRVAAAAGFHGGNLAFEGSDSPHLLADRITAELYFGHADEDHALPPEQIARLEQALTAAGVRHHCEVFTGAPHGFTRADTGVFDPEASERHWRALLSLLNRTFGRAVT